MHLLELIDVAIGYEAVKIINNISLYIDEEEIIAIIGPNGHGKSTLLKGIVRLNTIHHGKILFRGIDISAKEPHEVAKLGVKYVPETGGYFPYMSIMENLKIGGYHLQSYDFKIRLKEIEEIFPWIKHRYMQVANTLSGGERKMLSIARALISKPEILLLDEPSLGLAPRAKQEIKKAITSIINNTKISIILTESDLTMVKDLANKIFLLKNGKLKEIEIDKISGNLEEYLI
jgi:branched-chain amino acid transport system ATP-binding protein